MHTRKHPVLVIRAAMWCAAAVLLTLWGRGADAQAALRLPTPVVSETDTRNNRLLLAARHRQWGEAARLLEQGANPNMAGLSWPTPNGQVFYFERQMPPEPSAFSCAVSWGNINIVRLVLRHGASVNIGDGSGEGPLWDAVAARQPSIVRLLLHHGAGKSARSSFGSQILQQAYYGGDPDIIRQLETARNVPVWRRQIPSEPFAPGAKTVPPHVVAGTQGGVATERLLWASPHELIVLQNNPKRFQLCDTKTGQVTPLPNPTRRFLSSTEFDRDTLAVSPDGAWLVGGAGTKKRPTWLAVSVRGRAFQEWPCDTDWHVNGRGLSAWRDGHRWAELPCYGDHRKLTVRTLGRTHAQGEAMNRGVGINQLGGTLFRFLSPNTGQLDNLSNTGNWGADAPEPPDCDQFYVQTLHASPAGWQVTERSVRLFRTQHAGNVYGSVASPDGSRTAFYMGYQQTRGVALVVGDRDGQHRRVVFAHFDAGMDAYTQSYCPAGQHIEWAPDGTALSFWNIGGRQTGVCLVPVPAATNAH